MEIFRKIIAVLGLILLFSGMAYYFLFRSDGEKYLDQGKEYFKESKYKEALFYFEKAEEFDIGEALKYSGTIYLESGDPQKAIVKFDKYLKIGKPSDNDRKMLLNDLGVAYFKLNEIEKAKIYWRQAADLGNITSANNLKELETKLVK